MYFGIRAPSWTPLGVPTPNLDHHAQLRTVTRKGSPVTRRKSALNAFDGRLTTPADNTSKIGDTGRTSVPTDLLTTRPPQRSPGGRTRCVVSRDAVQSRGDGGRLDGRRLPNRRQGNYMGAKHGTRVPARSGY